MMIVVVTVAIDDIVDIVNNVMLANLLIIRYHFWR